MSRFTDGANAAWPMTNQVRGSVPSGSPRCGGCWPGRASGTGPRRSTWTVLRSRWPIIGRTGGLPRLSCWSGGFAWTSRRCRPIPGLGAAAPCIRTSVRCRSVSWPTPRPSTPTRSSARIVMCPRRIGLSRSNIGTGAACFGAASTVLLCGICRRVMSRSTPPGCGARCWPPAWPAGYTSSPPPKGLAVGWPDGAHARARP
jgi:hypothetical protein